jgi:NAD(P)-dependent dehydrogenase (short-subunit alcohol dehydrogenase family)
VNEQTSTTRAPDEQAVDLTGTTALVTGGTSGLGLAMVRALAGAGAAVAFTGRHTEKVRHVEATVPGALGLVADARDVAAVAAAIDTAWRALGSLAFFVNNAGIGMATVNPRFLVEPLRFWQVPMAGFRDVLETNLTGYFIAACAIAPRMLAAGSGRIVNVSINHATMRRAGFVPYGPSRAGSEALSRIMAADLAGTGVTVNILVPGQVTATGMLPPDAPRPADFAIADPAIMGPPIVWLASPAAAGVHDQRIAACEFDSWLAQWRAAHPGA